MERERERQRLKHKENSCFQEEHKQANALKTSVKGETFMLKVMGVGDSKMEYVQLAFEKLI